MTARSNIIQKIIERIDQMPNGQLENILSYVDRISKMDEDKKVILSYAGSWKDLDDELFDDLTVNLHENRLKETNKPVE